MFAAALVAVLPLTALPAAGAETGAPATTGPEAATGGWDATAALRPLLGQVTDTGGKPLAGAEVELFRYTAGRVAVTSSDPDGYFRFPELADGVYWLRIWAPGHESADLAYVPGSQEPFLSVALRPLQATVVGQALDARTGRPVSGAELALVRTGVGTVATTESRADGHFALAAPAGGGYALQVQATGYQPQQVQLAELAAGRQSGVTLQLEPATARLGGVVVSTVGGQPVRLARVRVLRSGFGVVAEAHTDDQGMLNLDLPAASGEAGQYELEVIPPGHGILRTGPFDLAGGTVRSFTGADRLAVAPVQAAVAGRVLKVDGRGDSGGEVLLERQGVGVVATVKPELDGTFRIGGIHVQPGARYRLRVLGHEGARTGAATDWLELQPGLTREVTLQFTYGHGDSYDEGNLRVIVTDPSGRPVEGATIALYRDGFGLVREATTDEQGRRLFVGIEANQPPADAWWAQKGNGYVVRIQKEGYYDLLVGEPVLDITKEQEMVVNAVLYPLTAPVTGRVADPDGQPVAGAQVTLYPEGGGQALQTTTDTLGAFRFPEVSTARRWTVGVRASGYWPGAGSQVLTLDPAQGSVVNITLHGLAAELYGRVADETGAAVSGALVAVQGPDGKVVTARADANGRYSLGSLPAGTPLAVRVGPVAGGADGTEAGETPGASLTPGGEPVAPVTLAAGERRLLDLSLRSQTGVITGTVMDAAGRPLPGVPVQLVREGEGAVDTARTDAQGRYRFDGVPVNPVGGRYLVRVSNTALSYRQVGSTGLPALFRIEPGQVANRHLVVAPLK